MLAKMHKQRKIWRAEYKKRYTVQKPITRGTSGMTPSTLTPTIASVAPTTVTKPATTTVTLTGTKYTASTRATVNGDVMPTTYISPTSISFSFVSANYAVGQVRIGAVNGGVHTPSTIVFTVA